jgi:hypothetical protein
LKTGSLNLLEPYGPFQTCTGIALPLPLLCSVHVPLSTADGKYGWSCTSVPPPPRASYVMLPLFPFSAIHVILPLFPLCASLSCYRETFTFTLTLLLIIRPYVVFSSCESVLSYGTARIQIISHGYQLHVLVNGQQEHQELTRTEYVSS